MQSFIAQNNCYEGGIMKKPKILKKTKKYSISLFLLIISIISILILALISALAMTNVLKINDSVIKFIFAFLGFLLPIVKKLFEDVRDSSPWETYLNFLRRKGKINKNDVIRVSYAAFFIIEVENEYLLLKNSHGMNVYLMPSMTYKITPEDKKYLMEKFHLIKDSFLKKDYDDYRLLVPQNELKKFYRHFCEQFNPYEDDYKHIMDNIVEKCGLSKPIFENITTVFKGRYIKNIEYSRYSSHFEMILGDVFEVCLNEEQKKEIARIKTLENNDNYRFATIDEIKSNGIDTSKGKMVSDIAVNAYDCFDSNILFK